MAATTINVVNSFCTYLYIKGVSVKNGNRNDRIRNGNDRNRKWPRNFLHKLKFLAILCRKSGSHFRFRSFPLRIRSFRFTFFTETHKKAICSFKNVSKNRSQAKFINHNISSIKVKTLNLGTLQNKYNRRGLNLKAC